MSASEEDYRQRIEKLEIERDAFRTEGVLWRRWADSYLGGGAASDGDLRKLLDDRLRRVAELEDRYAETMKSNQTHAERNRELEAQLEDLRGRKLGNADAWAEAAIESLGMYDHMRGLHEAMKATIRALLGTEQPAGELRKALGELVK